MAKQLIDRFLNAIEVAGNKLPDPAVLFLILMIVVWVLSWPLSNVAFDATHPATGAPIEVANLFSAQGLTSLLSSMVSVSFVPPPP